MGLSPDQVRERRDSILSSPPLAGVKEEKSAKVKKDKKTAVKSCSECRRLKAKCDRVFPCSNCLLFSHCLSDMVGRMALTVCRPTTRMRSGVSRWRPQLYARQTTGPSFDRAASRPRMSLSPHLFPQAVPFFN